MKDKINAVTQRIEGKAISIILVALLTVITIIVPGCTRESQTTVKIGVVYPLTGSFATAGADAKNGILLAMDIVNNEYNLDLPLARLKGLDSLNGAKLEVIFGDSQGSASVGALETQRLIDSERVVAVIGCYQSAVTAEASRIAEDKQIPFLTAISTTPSLTQRGFKWFFRTTPNEETFVQNIYEFLQDIQSDKTVEVNRLAIVHEESIWGAAVSNYERQYAEEYGYQVVENISYTADAVDVRSEVQRLKDARPDVVMPASYVNDAILYMQTFKEMRFNPQAILADNNGFIATAFLKELGDDGNYILTRENWAGDLVENKPLAGVINQMFQEHYGANMNGFSARAFTGMLVMANAINRAGSTSQKAIHKALLKTDIPGEKLIMPWNGVRFDRETHQNTLGNGIICQIINQEYCTVWPSKLATTEVIWPMPS
ncbi:ABC transporter substrate-binding protein [Chloroflexota bacterium]